MEHPAVLSTGVVSIDDLSEVEAVAAGVVAVEFVLSFPG